MLYFCLYWDRTVCRTDKKQTYSSNNSLFLLLMLLLLVNHFYSLVVKNVPIFIVWKRVSQIFCKKQQQQKKNFSLRQNYTGFAQN